MKRCYVPRNKTHGVCKNICFFFVCFHTDFRPIKDGQLIRLVGWDMRTDQTLFFLWVKSDIPRIHLWKSSKNICFHLAVYTNKVTVGSHAFLNDLVRAYVHITNFQEKGFLLNNIKKRTLLVRRVISLIFFLSFWKSHFS